MTRRPTSLIAVLLVALLTSACGLTGQDDTRVVAEFSRGFNLFPGSDVRVLGLPVGRVVDVTADEGSNVVRAVLRLDPDVELPADVNAHVIQGSLLGERIVELEPAYTGGPVLAAGSTIPVARTTVPSEFDEILESLNDVLSALPPDELGRLIRNTAELVDGRGERIGTTLDDVATAVAALREADDDLVSLIARLADLNATLATRDVALQAVIDDYATLMATLASERDTIDAALSEVARVVTEVRRLTDAHADRADETLEGVTRLGRTLSRNLDEIDRLLYGQSELFRHAERVFDLEHNWLPLVNHSEDLGRMIQDRLSERLVGLCERLDRDDCTQPAWWETQLPASVCIPGMVACLERNPATGAPPDELPLEEAIARATERVPELTELLAEDVDLGGELPADRDEESNDPGRRERPHRDGRLWRLR
jgi:phospholipid/cholesterol/gamma-HCH transport system substrate-binding protein